MNTLKNATVLAIDSDLQVLLKFKELLSDQCKELLLENNLEQGLKLAHEKQPDLILLDIKVDKMDGYEICEQLKKNKQTQLIPIIFFSSLLRTADKVKCFEIGAAGYIFRPSEKRRVSDHKREHKLEQMEDIVSQIKACFTSRTKKQHDFQASPLNIVELLQDYHFKAREIEILRLYISGYKRSEIATKIYLSENTVKWYLKQIFQKLNVDNRAALLEKTQELEILTRAGRY
jgi:DNA-binding NarL/FixJ family response regulator